MADEQVIKSDSAEETTKTEIQAQPETAKEVVGVVEDDVFEADSDDVDISAKYLKKQFSVRDKAKKDDQEGELEEEVVLLNRVAKVVKGGRRFSFCALVVVGDRKSKIGIGYGKANEVPEAIRKAVDGAKKNLKEVVTAGRTIPHEVIGEFGAARILLKPATEGTGVIAGTGIRTVLELAGIKDVLSKRLGSDNKINVIKATHDGLLKLRNSEEIGRLRGKTVKELYKA